MSKINPVGVKLLTCLNIFFVKIYFHGCWSKRFVVTMISEIVGIQADGWCRKRKRSWQIFSNLLDVCISTERFNDLCMIL